MALGELITDGYKYVAESLAYIAGMGPWKMVKVFWFFFLLDMPRYLLVDVVMFFITIFSSPREPFYGLKKRKPPLVTVIVPALNEEDTIGKTITSLMESTYPTESLEIIVVDDGSTDNTYAIAREYSRQKKPDIRVVSKAVRGGKASCLALGLEMASGEFIVSVDSDTTFDRDAIPNLLRAFNDPDVGAVSGNVKVRNSGTNLLTALQYCEYLIGISMGRRWLAKVNMLTIVSGAFGAYRRKVLEDTGAWDPGIGDDSNVTLKTRKSGYKVAFEPEAVVMTNAPTSLRKLFIQRRRWNRSFIRNRFRKHKNILNPFTFAPINLAAISLTGFYRVVLLFTFFFFLIQTLMTHTQIFPLILFLGWMVYTLSTLLSLIFSISLSERRKQEWKLLAHTLLFPIYRLFLRFPRLAAFTTEFFRIDYEDPFYPEHVWSQAPRW